MRHIFALRLYGAYEMYSSTVYAKSRCYKNIIIMKSMIVHREAELAIQSSFHYVQSYSMDTSHCQRK